MKLISQGSVRWIFFCFLLLGSFFISAFLVSHIEVDSKQPIPNPREGWAVLLEMNDYPGTSNDLTTNFIDSRTWNATLHTVGWQSHHIQLYQGYLDQIVGENALRFLAQNADANDVVLFSIFAHGNWISDEMNWFNWFPAHWESLVSQEKLLVVSACSSEAMIQPLLNDPAPHVHLASSRIGEYSWAGLPEEGLPVIGEVFTHFFTRALTNSSADSNGNGDICIEEAFVFASPQSREYISSVVFPAYPYFSEMCNHTAPHPVIDDAYIGNFSLQVELGEPPSNLLFWIPLELVLFGTVLSLFCVILLLGLFIIRKH